MQSTVLAISIIILALCWGEENFTMASLWNFFWGGTPAAYGGSQARGQITAVAASLHHSHSNTISDQHLQPTPQLRATPEPQPTEQGQGSNLHPHGC